VVLLLNTPQILVCISIFLSSLSSVDEVCHSSLKEEQRTRQFAALKSSHSGPLTDPDFFVLSSSLANIVSYCSSGNISTSDIRDVYLKRTIAAHEATNCISDFLPYIPEPPGNSLPLLGVPISIKDCFDIKDHDTTLGYSRNVNRPAQTSSVIVQMLLAAGATLHVKTTVPIGLLSLETHSDLYGYTTNPYSEKHSAGASTGGGGALLAFGGSKIEIGSDVGGSVRVPAHFCGIYGLKASSRRFPVAGAVTCYPGFLAISTVTSPMAADLDDLEEFCHRFIDLKPWEQDPTVCIYPPY
jgi:Asp-tRNA(Asn)/Glu-tRNA(Gln) amidotransferase A subunit family amidase